MDGTQHENFLAQLRKQLNFLTRSAAIFDHGATDEAIRIAVSLRVLFHDGRSPSLLSHLGARNIKVTSIMGTGVISDVGPSDKIVIGLMKHSPSAVPMLSYWGEAVTNGLPIAAIKAYEVPLEDWWNAVLVETRAGLTMSRRDIVLNAADKDGGAHVDKKLTQDYLDLAKGNVLSPDARRLLEGFMGGGMTYANAHLIALRDMAFEVLNSPQILALADTRSN